MITFSTNKLFIHWSPNEVIGKSQQSRVGEFLAKYTRPLSDLVSTEWFLFMALCTLYSPLLPKELKTNQSGKLKVLFSKTNHS